LGPFSPSPLRRTGVRPSVGRHLAALAGQSGACRALAAAGAALEAEDWRGRRAMHDAAALGQSDTVAVLAALGCRVSARYGGLQGPWRMPFLNNANATALHDAAAGGFTATCLQAALPITLLLLCILSFPQSSSAS